MMMLRFFVLPGLLFGFISTQAEAKTIRYEFDVVNSVIDYNQLYKSDVSGGDNTVSAAEYEAFTARFHDLGMVQGQTGTVVLEATPDIIHPEPNNFTGYLSCVSGFLCSVADIFNPADKPPVRVFSSGFSFGPCCGGFRHEWSLDGAQGTLHFKDDGDFLGSGVLDDIRYSWWMPQARFTLGNLSVSVLDAAPTPVPLPATAWFLGLGLAALGMQARRRAA